MGLAAETTLQRRRLRPTRMGRAAPIPKPAPGDGAGAADCHAVSYKSAGAVRGAVWAQPYRNGEDPWGLDNQGGGLDRRRFDISGYLDYQGRVSSSDSTPIAYLAILRTMDTWDLRGAMCRLTRPSPHPSPAELRWASALTGCFRPRRCGILRHDSRGRSGCRLREMTTDHGHDAFLAEQVNWFGCCNNQPDTPGQTRKDTLNSTRPGRESFPAPVSSPYAGPECKKSSTQARWLPQALKIPSGQQAGQPGGSVAYSGFLRVLHPIIGVSECR